MSNPAVDATVSGSVPLWGWALDNRGVTSLGKLTGREIPVAEVEDHLIRHFCSVFDRIL